MTQKIKRPTTAESVRSNTFRHHYRELAPEEAARVERIKDLAELLEKEIHQAGTGHNPAYGLNRCASVAMTRLEEAVMWAVKGVTL